MKRHKLHSTLSIILIFAFLICLMPPTCVKAQPNATLPSGIDQATVVWDVENAPDDMTSWVIDRFREEWGGNYGVSAGQWTPRGVNGKGADNSRALQWEVHGNEWGSTSYIVLSNDSTAITDWTGAQNLYFYIDASEQTADFCADLLLYTNANHMIEMINGATYYYWDGTQWVQTAIDNYHHMSISAGYKGWIKLPLAQVYNNPDLGEVQRLGFLLEHHLVGASVYFDHFAADIPAATIPDELSTATVVWDVENAPDDMTSWVIDRFKEEWGGNYGVSAGQWTPRGVNGKGADNSRALQWEVHGNEWGSTSYIVLSNDSTAITDWTGAQNLYFYIDASEQTADFCADLLLYTNANHMIEMINGATYYYWDGTQWVQTAIDNYHHMSISAGYKGWIKLPLAQVYNNPDLNDVQRLGFLLEHHLVGASVYFDHFAVDLPADPTDPAELDTAITVWDMENLPDSFNNWCIDKYVEIGWRQDGEVGVSGGFWTPSGENGKGYSGSRALAWTQNTYLWGSTSYIVLANDKTAITDWRGAQYLYFYIDASEITENFALDILLYTEGNGDKEMVCDATYSYWDGYRWIDAAIDQWHHTIISAGYTGWLRLPLAEVYGNPDLRNIRRIGFLAEHHMEDATVYIDHFSVDQVNSAPTFNRAELNTHLTNVNLVPDAATHESADYFCTWSTQGSTCYAAGVTVRDILTHETLFGENGWAYLYSEEIRKDLIFVLDDGWDLPYSENGVDNSDFYGSFILDEEKFPNYGDSYVDRMKTLVNNLKAAGWKGVGVWVCCQEDAAHRPSGGSWDQSYWAERIQWCKEAGITYWKIDWGNYYTSVAWRQFISDTAQRIYPELIIEHITGDVGTNDPLDTGTTQKTLDKMVTVAGFSDVFRTYDVTTQLSISTTMERVARLLKAGYTLTGDHMGLINCEDEVYLAAALGLSAGVMRSEHTGMSALEEVNRGILWHRLAPAFELAGYDVLVSDTVLSDAWHFQDDTWDATINNKTVTQYAPAAVSRGIALPTVTSAGEIPFLAASRNPLTGAISIASFRRTSVGNANHLVYADVSLNVGKLTGPIGIFGVYESLTLTFDESIEGKQILAQDLLSKKAFDITDFVTVNGGTILIHGDLLKYIGLYSGNVNDSSEPALVLQIGESADYEEIPAMNQRTEGGEYTVQLPSGNGFTVTSDGNTVRHSRDFTFTVQVTESGKQAVVKVNGMELEGNNGVYTITNVVCDQQVTIALVDAPVIPTPPGGSEEPQFSIDVPTGNGFTVSYTGGNVASGDSFSFTVSVTDSTKVAIVKVNGVVLNAVNGVYTVRNVLSDQQITVTLVNAPAPTDGTTDPTEPTSPAETFDPSALPLAAILCIISAAAVCLVVARKKQV